MSDYLKRREREKRLEKIRGKVRNGNGNGKSDPGPGFGAVRGGAKERHARRRIAAGVSVDVIEVDEWRDELLEASDAGETQVLGYNEKVYLAPVIADLEPGVRRWFRGLVKHTADTDADAMRLDAYREEQEFMFRALDEQINNASSAQILEYKRKALEA